MNATTPLRNPETPSLVAEANANLPAIAPSGFPVSYEEARVAITRCESPIECRTMADKAAAMAVFARMRNDTDLQNRAVRLQAWADRQWGKLDRELHPNTREKNLQQNQGSDRKAHAHLSGSRPVPPDGTTEYQRKISRRLASIPEEDFKAQVEGPSPPSVRQLAEQGTARRAPPQATPRMYVPDNIKPAPIEQATRAQARLREFAAFCGVTEPAAVARACATLDIDAIRGYVETIDSWLDRFVVVLPSGSDESETF